MIHRRAPPAGCAPTLLKEPCISKTIEGEFSSKTSVRLKNMMLPEFDQNELIDSQEAHVFDGNS